MCAHDIHLIKILEIYLSRYPLLTKNSLMSFCKKYLIKCCFREIFNKYPCVSNKYPCCEWEVNINVLRKYPFLRKISTWW